MPKFDTDHLTKRIEQVIQEHLVATERAANEAIARAFAPRRSTAPRVAATPAERTSAGRRRSANEMSVLCEQLSQAVSAKPGETMTVLAEGLGQRPRALSRPMELLRQQEQVRSVGKRHLTRYYPLNPK